MAERWEDVYIPASLAAVARASMWWEYWGTEDHPPVATPAAQHLEPVCVEPRPSALNMTLPAFAAGRRRLHLSIDISYPQDA